jgi:hypothetical protein
MGNTINLNDFWGRKKKSDKVGGNVGRFDDLPNTLGELNEARKQEFYRLRTDVQTILNELARAILQKPSNWTVVFADSSYGVWLKDTYTETYRHVYHGVHRHTIVSVQLIFNEDTASPSAFEVFLTPSQDTQSFSDIFKSRIRGGSGQCEPTEDALVELLREYSTPLDS